MASPSAEASAHKRSRTQSFRALGLANLVADLEATHHRLLGDPAWEVVDGAELSSSIREAGFLPSREIILGDRPALPLAEEHLEVEVQVRSVLVCLTIIRAFLSVAPAARKEVVLEHRFASHTLDSMVWATAPEVLVEQDAVDVEPAECTPPSDMPSLI